MEKFITSLMKKMTIEEKLGQLNLPASGDMVTGETKNSEIGIKIKEGKVGGLFNIKSVAKIKEVQRIAVEESRLKIPLLFGMDVIHGYETVFPIPLAQSCTWNMDLIREAARISAIEASADGINWTFSPMVDLCRDPRWGRIAEGIGEDPFIGYHIAKAMVQGYQGQDLSANNTIMSCVKHFALYGAAESGRDYNTTDMSRIRMYNEYFMPYKGAVDAGVGSVMASFNEVDGIPATANKWLITDVLRDQWSFKGFVVSDYTGINEMIDHGLGDIKTVSMLALRAGVDMDMVGEGFLSTSKQSIDEKKLTVKQIDVACRRVLEAKYKLGLFDDPYKYCDLARASREIYNATNKSKARQMGPESFVLLKNEGSLLPLKKSATIALVGPLAGNSENMPGTWSVAAKHSKAVSVLEGFKSVVGGEGRIVYAKGSNLHHDPVFETNATVFGKTLNRDQRSAQTMIDEAVEATMLADVVVAAIGESAEMSGEASSRADIGIPQAQMELIDALIKTGKPVVVLLFTGRPLEISALSAKVPAILNVWFPGSEAGLAIADAVYGYQVPSGKLTTTWPRHQGQIPIYYNHKNTGRPLGNSPWFSKFRSNYLDVPNEPLYPFGYGLSYARFEYGKLSLSKTNLRGNDLLKVSIPVQNTSMIKGKEIVQLYIRDVVGSITRPVKELKGFQKVDLEAGETKNVVFEIAPDLLKFYNSELQYDWESGDFEIMVGPNSKDVQSIKINWVK
jgi:beta-glucosidase